MRKLYSQDAEQSVLGAMLIEPNHIDDVADLLTPASFGIPAHQELYAAITKMRAANMPTDVVTVAETLGERDDLGMEYLVDLAGSVPPSINALSYAKIVDERHQERALYETTLKVQALLMEGELTPQQRMSEAQRLFASLESEKPPTTRIELNESLERVLEQIDRAHNTDEALGITTGLADLDKRLGGYRGGNLILLGARPGMGKTTVMMHIVRHVIRHHGKALVFSLEMPHEELTKRLVSSAGSANMDMIRNPGSADEAFWPSLTAGVTALKDLPLVIDDAGGLTIDQLMTRARREHRRSPLEFIAVDYIQLLRSGRRNSDNRNLEVGEISMGLKNLAKELNIPVLALSQLNRGLETRTDKRPMPADLRESGSLEQDADLIHFLYRDEVYNDDSEWKGVMEIITAKFRDGKTGTDRVLFLGQYNQLADMDAEKFVSQQEAYQPKYSYGDASQGEDFS